MAEIPPKRPGDKCSCRHERRWHKAKDGGKCTAANWCLCEIFRGEFDR